MRSRRDLAPDLFLSGAVGLSNANPMAATMPAACAGTGGTHAPAIWSVSAANATNRRLKASQGLKSA